jgi:SET domain-containing protein
MINHSCLPNAAVSFQKRRALLRAETAIRSGDEIEISYVGESDPELCCVPLAPRPRRSGRD